ncbi:hypothetical protein Aspvir_008409 [Aspergillus viridinutans]|uniref:Uncharacterized protein n=1 Tax=Aspergillus viridinutans TaxID=75553 RepID=A0A9P3C5M5_ASPVI|nr:uncharacterized protein Aspvir_008409 [Aspergillus viridinutans]GIK04329.1 hypothetical protein Aspvir_008409 [Aspergillus viridinutans]
MSTAVWDPDTILQIDEGSGLGIFYVGLEPSNYDSRCRLVIPQDRSNAILCLLDSLSIKLPHDVTKRELRRLARLGLCRHHGYQVNDIMAKWVTVLHCIEHVYQPYKERLETSLQVSNSFLKEVNKCKSLLRVKEDSVKALPVILRRHISNKAQLEKELVASQATYAQLLKDQGMLKDQKEENCRLIAKNFRLSTLLKRAKEEQERYKNQETNLTAECEKLRKQNAEFQADINSGKDKYNDLQEQEQSATMELMATTTQLHKAQSLNLGLENNKKTLQSEISILKQEVGGLNNKNTSITSQLASTAASLETVTEELCATHKENMEFHNELITATREIIELRSTISQLSTPVWYRVIQWIKQKLSGLRHLQNPGKEVSDAEEGVALAPTITGSDAGLS